MERVVWEEPCRINCDGEVLADWVPVSEEVVFLAMMGVPLIPKIVVDPTVVALVVSPRVIVDSSADVMIAEDGTDDETVIVDAYDR